MIGPLVGGIIAGAFGLDVMFVVLPLAFLLLYAGFYIAGASSAGAARCGRLPARPDHPEEDFPMPVIDVNGLPMGYELRGSGDPIVLVAGTGYAGPPGRRPWSSRWPSATPCVTFDHRGTGATPPDGGALLHAPVRGGRGRADGPAGPGGGARRRATRWAAAWRSG